MIALMLAAVTIAGTLAAIFVSPLFLLSTIILVAMIARATRRADPTTATQPDFAEFPSRARDACCSTSSCKRGPSS
jgi:hypothetical protein